MISVRKVDTRNKADVNSFVDLPYRLYRGHPQWVPPPRMDVRSYLRKDKHPFYEHSEADFYVAEKDGEIVGRIAVLVNKRYNQQHDKQIGQFYFFECQKDIQIAEALFEQIFAWARKRGLNQMMGPKGMGPLDGYGMLVEGFEHRQLMTMMNYNFEYYPQFMEKLGFRKEVDFVSHHIHVADFQISERIHRIAERVQKRGKLRVLQMKNKRQLRSWADSIGKAYNNAFVDNWEYVPLTEKEIKFVVDTVILLANPRFIKLIVHEQDVVGFLFAFPDVSDAMQRAKGNLLPFGIFDMLLDMRRTNWVAVNGMGILPEHQGRGGNALLYSEMEKTLRGSGFEHADLTQVAESAVQMRSDLENLGGKAYKNHRVFIRDI
jgi:GNAT superfamily N-acetyltransferase